MDRRRRPRRLRRPPLTAPRGGPAIALQTLDRQEVDRFPRTFEELFDRGDAAAMAAYYTEDAEVLAPTARWCERIVVDSANREPARR